jgi:hypothetical protein
MGKDPPYNDGFRLRKNFNQNLVSKIHRKREREMEDKPKSIEEILKMMEQGLGEEPRPMVLMSKLLPEWIP